MLTVQFGNFSKRKNSTARPASLAAPFSVALKENTSYDNPTFKLTAAAFDYNYCKWDDRYYFVVDIISERNNGWSVVCELDLMATYRSEIHNTNAFVEYAADGNDDIPDTRLGVEYGVAGVNVTNAAVFPGGLIYAPGSKYITVLGQSTTDTYYISDASLSALFNAINTWQDSVIDNTSIDTILETGLKQLIGSGSAAECIRDAYMLPNAPIPGTLGSAENIRLGMYNTGVAGNKISGNGEAIETTTISIPHQYNDWRKQSPYEICQLFLPLYGTINIPSDIAADSTSLTIECRLNVRSGDYTYYISGNGRNGNEIVVGGNCAAPLPVGASNINVASNIGGIASGLIQAAAGLPGGAISASLSILSPVPHSTGAAGGISNKYPNAQCMIYYRNTSATPRSIATSQGKPLLAQRRLGDLSGYVQTKGASVSGTLHGEQYDRVNAILDGGAFIE